MAGRDEKWCHNFLYVNFRFDYDILDNSNSLYYNMLQHTAPWSAMLCRMPFSYKIFFIQTYSKTLLFLTDVLFAPDWKQCLDNRTSKYLSWSWYHQKQRKQASNFQWINAHTTRWNGKYLQFLSSVVFSRYWKFLVTNSIRIMASWRSVMLHYRHDSSGPLVNWFFFCA